jgi:class 3 adenylate cyclase
VTDVAARLVALASGGQALTTRATADLAGCGCRPAGPRTLKNVTGLIDVVEVLPREESGQPVVVDVPPAASPGGDR